MSFGIGMTSVQELEAVLEVPLPAQRAISRKSFCVIIRALPLADLHESGFPIFDKELVITELLLVSPGNESDEGLLRQLLRESEQLGNVRAAPLDKSHSSGLNAQFIASWITFWMLYVAG